MLKQGFPNCPSGFTGDIAYPLYSNNSNFSLFCLSAICLILSLLIALNYNSIIILNRFTESLLLRNQIWAAYFGILGVSFTLEFLYTPFLFSWIGIAGEILKRSGATILCQCLCYEKRIRCSRQYLTEAQDSVIVTDHEPDYEPDYEPDHEAEQDEQVPLLAGVNDKLWMLEWTSYFTLLFSCISLLSSSISNHAQYQWGFLIACLSQQIPTLAIAVLILRVESVPLEPGLDLRVGPGILAKIVLLIGMLTSVITWTSTSLIRGLIDQVLPKGEEYPVKMCIVPPYWWGDPPRG